MLPVWAIPIITSLLSRAGQTEPLQVPQLPGSKVQVPGMKPRQGFGSLLGSLGGLMGKGGTKPGAAGGMMGGLE